MDTTVSKALASAMDIMSSSISKSFAQAILQAQSAAPPAAIPAAIPTVSHPTHPGRKASAKVRHSSKKMMDSSKPVTDGAHNDPPRKRASSRAKAAMHWKWAKAQQDY
ncbi:Hypothetical predicted protein [Pelobates cultripes]|uniref:Uncharacterized protein n=1 Tax=Pelobates cultripes TaxID=61616 RepID=A0AAD1RFE9_PELCU|nr:Hypothetical predicted protein [Pelobates cultripes]